MYKFTCPHCHATVSTDVPNCVVGHDCKANLNSRGKPKLTHFVQESKIAWQSGLSLADLDAMAEAESADFPRYEVVPDCRVSA